MNIDFKICWFEDTPEWYEDAKEHLEEYIDGYSFIPEIKLYDSSDFDINALKKNEYDLILVDYTLDRSSSGIDIIKELRQNDIYTDIIFYSSQYDKMKKDILTNDDILDIMDGVFFSDREGRDFYKKTEGVILKLIKRAEEIVNLRGIILDSTCEFDKKMEDILIIVLSKFDENKRIQINRKAREIVKKSTKEKKNKAERMCASDTFVLDIIQDNKSHILESSHKARLINKTIEIMKEEELIDASKFEGFYNKFFKEIINVRNMIAHVTYDIEKNAFIGKVNGEVEILTCDRIKCIRRDIIKYKNMFLEIEESFNRI